MWDRLEYFFLFSIKPFDNIKLYQAKEVDKIKNKAKQFDILEEKEKDSDIVEFQLDILESLSHLHSGKPFK